MTAGLGFGHGADVLGALLITASLMLGVYTIVEPAARTAGAMRRRSRSRRPRWLCSSPSSPVRRSPRNPLVPLRIFRSRNVAGANLIQALTVAGMFGMFFLGVLYLQEVLGYDALETGLAFLPTTLVMGTLSVRYAEPLIMRFGARRTLLPGLLLIAIGLALFATVPVHGSYVADVLPPTLLLGLGVGVSFPALMTLAMSGATREDAGLASGLVNTTAQVGAAIGLAVLATLSASRTDDLLAQGDSTRVALTGGYELAFGWRRVSSWRRSSWRWQSSSRSGRAATRPRPGWTRRRGGAASRSRLTPRPADRRAVEPVRSALREVADQRQQCPGQQRLDLGPGGAAVAQPLLRGRLGRPLEDAEREQQLRRRIVAGVVVGHPHHDPVPGAAHDRLDLGVAAEAALAAEQHRENLVVALEGVEESGHVAGDEVLEREVGEGGVDHLRQPCGEVGDDGQVEVALGPEVVVDEAGGDAGAARDRLHRGVGVVVGDEHLAGGGEDLLAAYPRIEPCSGSGHQRQHTRADHY